MMNTFIFILIIVLLYFILIPFWRKKIKILLILGFNDLISNFIEQYYDYKTIISMDLDSDELKHFLQAEFSNETEAYYPIRVELFFSSKHVLAHTSLELRNLLRLYGEQIINYQDHLEEKYKIKFNIKAQTYSSFLDAMINLRTLCANDILDVQGN